VNAQPVLNDIKDIKNYEISLLFTFAKQAKFRETVSKFRLVSCFAKPKRHSKMFNGTPVQSYNYSTTNIQRVLNDINSTKNHFTLGL
jgi:hypothetical protein